MPTQIIERHTGNLIEATCGVDMAAGTMVIPSTIVEDPYVGNLGTKIVPNNSAFDTHCWVVELNIMGDTNGTLDGGFPYYDAGSILRVAAMNPGDVAWVRCNTAIPIGTPLKINTLEPGTVVAWSGAAIIIGFALSETTVAAPNFIKVIF